MGCVHRSVATRKYISKSRGPTEQVRTTLASVQNPRFRIQNRQSEKENPKSAVGNQQSAIGNRKLLVPGATTQFAHDVSHKPLGIAEEHQGFIEVVERV